MTGPGASLESKVERRRRTVGHKAPECLCPHTVTRNQSHARFHMDWWELPWSLLYEDTQFPFPPIPWKNSLSTKDAHHQCSSAHYPELWTIAELFPHRSGLHSLLWYYTRWNLRTAGLRSCPMSLYTPMESSPVSVICAFAIYFGCNLPLWSLGCAPYYLQRLDGQI